MSENVHELDEVAAALGRRAAEREHDSRAPEWEAVARGELTAQAAIEQRRSLGDEQDLDRAAEYFRPFDHDETAALVDSLLACGEAESAEVDEPAEAEVLPLRPPEPNPSGVWWLPAGLLLAAAAAILLWIVLPPNDDIRDLTDGAEVIATKNPLPNYVLETDGGLKQLRGTADEPASGRHQYRRDTAFEWILRPAIDSTEPIGVRGFVFVDGASAGLPLALDELVQVAGSGAIRITGTIEQLGLEPGRYTITLAVGRPEALPEQAIELNAAKTDDEAWQIRRIDVEIDG